MTHKNALVTGASLRIGQAIAKCLAHNGWNIAIHYRSSEEAAKALQAELTTTGTQSVLVQGDLADAHVCQRVFSETASTLGPITCLVNNASIFEPDDFETLSPDTFDKHMHTNLRGPLLLSQAMAAQEFDFGDIQGNIVNIVDQRVFHLRPDFTTYTLSKAALWTLTQTSAMAFAPGIRVNAIGPGPTLPNSRQSQAQFDNQCENVPLQYGASPEEIANGVLFLVNSPSITGEFIAMDGGQHLPSSVSVKED